MTELDHEALLVVLNAHGVRFAVIGGIAAQIRDLPLPATVGLDITPARDDANLAALAEAFDELEAGLLTADAQGTWFPRVPVENWAQYDTLHLMTKHGPLDIVFAPDGAEAGFADLAANSSPEEVGAVSPLVISVSTWVRLKEASGRAKDLEHLDRFSERRHEGGG